jgi:hypothetical protein
MNETIKQLLPVSGWYAVVASQSDQGEIKMEKLPLIAWAIIDGEQGHPGCVSPDSIEGVCVLATQPLVCGDTYEFQTWLQEVSGQVFVGYCSEGQLEAKPDYFREQSSRTLQVMEARRTVAPGKIQELQDRATFAALDDEGTISH